jgi:RNA polymerase sigma-70 factor (ECF subfamily)
MKKPSAGLVRRTGDFGGNLPGKTASKLCNNVSDDARLIERTLAGDPAAFGCLVQKYQDRLYNALLHIIGGAGARDEARDVAQDAFVQAFVKLETFRGSSQFYTWLYRIAFNIHISRKRRQRPSVSIDRVREASGDEPLSKDSPPAGDLEQHERAVQVREALALLSEEHRTILVLREIDDLDYEAIAEAMDVPVGTVRSRLHRARMQLRELLEQRVKEDLI